MPDIHQKTLSHLLAQPQTLSQIILTTKLNCELSIS